MVIYILIPLAPQWESRRRGYARRISGPAETHTCRKIQLDYSWIVSRSLWLNRGRRDTVLFHNIGSSRTYHEQVLIGRHVWGTFVLNCVKMVKINSRFRLI
jgi:hypothetical protein